MAPCSLSIVASILSLGSVLSRPNIMQGNSVTTFDLFQPLPHQPETSIIADEQLVSPSAAPRGRENSAFLQTPTLRPSSQFDYLLSLPPYSTNSSQLRGRSLTDKLGITIFVLGLAAFGISVSIALYVASETWRTEENEDVSSNVAQCSGHSGRDTPRHLCYMRGPLDDVSPTSACYFLPFF